MLVQEEAAAETSVVTRAWSAPLWVHAGVLAVLLALAVPFVGPHWQWSADEGAVLAQAQLLADGEGWRTPVPFPEVDPEGQWFPTHLSERADDGQWVPYAKLPLYPLVLAGLLEVGGMAAVVLFGVLGTVVAAWSGGWLAGRAGRELARPALWVLGLASPLLFDAYQVIAHSVGAGLVGLGAVLVVRWLRQPSPWALAGAAACAALVVALRNEGTFAVAAASVVLAAVAWRGRTWRPLVPAGAVAAAGAAAFLAGRAAHKAILGGGGGVGAPAAGDGGSYLDGRWDGFYQTFLEADGRTLLALSAAMLAVAALALRRRPPSRLLVLAGCVAAVVTAAVSVVAQELDVIPGLLVVSPVMLTGLLLVRRDDLRGPLGACAAVFALFAVAVLATQYRKGGSGEWGGRYFAIGLPLVVPLAVAALWRVQAGLDRELRRVVGGTLVALSVVLGVTALATLRQLHDLSDRVITNIVATAERTDPGDGGPPVVVSTLAAVPRLGWRQVPDGRWFLVLSQDDLDRAAAALRAQGVDGFTLASHPAYGTPELAGWVAVETAETSDGIPAVVYRRAGAAAGG